MSGIRLYGRTLLQQLDEWSLVGNDFIAAHAVWLDEADMRIMAERGASVVHNPGRNMKLGNGFFALRRMLDAGITVGIGTDCSDNQNVYEAMRLASLVSKGQTPYLEQWATVEEVCHAATVGGREVMGMQGGTAVRRVMVAGTMIVRDRVLTTVDITKLARDAEAARDRLESATAEMKYLTEKLALVVNSHCPGLAAAPYQIDRYV